MTGSVVVEENASTGGDDSSQDSGVYKNIIINLSNLSTSDVSEYRNLPPPPPSTDPLPLSEHGDQSESPQPPRNELVGILKKTK